MANFLYGGVGGPSNGVAMSLLLYPKFVDGACDLILTMDPLVFGILGLFSSAMDRDRIDILDFHAKTF